MNATCCGAHPVTYTQGSYASYHPAFRVPQVRHSSLSPLPTKVLLDLGKMARLGCQALMIVGCAFLLAQAVRRRIRPDIAALGAGAVVVALGAELIPGVGQFYGASRLYQQALVILGLAFIIMADEILKRFPRVLRRPILAVIVLLAFLSSSPLSAQYLGSPELSLQLNNSGLYYDLYYVHGADLAGITWLDAHAGPNSVIFADRFATRKIVTFSSRPLVIVDNVLPQNLTPNTYVFEDVDNVTRGVAYDFVDGVEVPYKFPTEFVAAHKKLVFRDGNVEIFQ